MTLLSDLSGMLLFRAASLRARAQRRGMMAGIVWFALGFLAFVEIRRHVYAALPEMAAVPSGPMGYVFDLKLFQVVFFVTIIYVPVIIALAGAMGGRNRAPASCGREYRGQMSVFLPLWGTLFLIAAPVQYLAPQFLVVGIVGVSVGMSTLLTLLGVYTFWAVKRLNDLSAAQSLGALALSCATLPLYYLLLSFPYAFLSAVLASLAYAGFRFIRRRLRSRRTSRSGAPDPRIRVQR
jgi:hypothetical protein